MMFRVFTGPGFRRRLLVGLCTVCGLSVAADFADNPFQPPAGTAAKTPVHRVTEPASYKAVGVAILGEHVVGVLRTPDQAFYIVEKGDAVAEVEVLDVTSESIVLKTVSGEMRLLLQD